MRAFAAPAAVLVMIASAASASIVNFDGATYEVSGAESNTPNPTTWSYWGLPQMCTTDASSDPSAKVEYTWSNFKNNAVFGVQVDLTADRIVTRFFNTNGGGVIWLAGPAVSGFLFRDTLGMLPDFTGASVTRSQSAAGARVVASVLDADTLFLDFQPTLGLSFRNLEEVEFRVSFVPSPGPMALLMAGAGLAARRRR